MHHLRNKLLIKSIANEEYNAWDDLNDKFSFYMINEIDTNEYFLSFRNTFDPFLLSEQYAHLPGVQTASPTASVLPAFSAFSVVYPMQVGESITYLFHYCPDFKNPDPDCINSTEYWHFESNGSLPILIGHWYPYEEPKEPEWWKEAQQNKQKYEQYINERFDLVHYSEDS